MDPELFVYPQDVDHAEVIRAAADASDLEAFVAAFRPAQDEYRRLKAALAEFRVRAASGDGLGRGARRSDLEAGRERPPGGGAAGAPFGIER